MTEGEAIKDSIAHHKRMLAWAEKQDLRELVDRDEMLGRIGEIWSADDCALCSKYFEKNCEGCPLDKKYGSCFETNAKNIYMKLNHSPNWGEYVKNEKLMIKQLESLMEN